MTQVDLSQNIEVVRHFNRFYTRQIGVLDEKLLQSPFSLTEARVIYELAHQETTTATQLCTELGLDPGYLSRMLRGFQKRGLLDKQPSAVDGRQSLLRLTPQGQEAFALLNAASQSEIDMMLRRLSEKDQQRLVGAIRTVEELLMGPSGDGAQKPPYMLRPHQPGDMGWVVHRHGLVYAQEYGWDAHFEALVAEIVAQFIQQYDPERERCWIAEMGGENVGSIFLVKQSDSIAKLRLLLVEPKARGLGIGRRLVHECIEFARQAGYTRITLWTNNVLHDARRIYQRTGFQLVHEEAHHSFGHDLIGETWELAL